MPLDHCSFQVSDMQRSIGFYTEKLGFKLLSVNINENVREEYAFLELDGARLELIRDLDGDFAPPVISKHLCPHICFEVGDLDAAAEALKRNGIAIIGGPHVMPGEEAWLYFADDDNNVLEYIQWFHKK